MNDKVQWKSDLIEGESLLWTGKPEKTGLLEGASRNLVYAEWAVSVVWVLASLLIYIPFALREEMSGMQMALAILIMDCIPMLVSVNPIRDWKCMNSSVSYAITSHRLLMKDGDRLVSMVIPDGMKTQVRGGKGGVGSMCFGDAVGQKPEKERTTALTSIQGDEGTTGMVFMAVKDPDGLLKFVGSVK